MSQTLSTQHLSRWLEAGENVELVDVLPHERFARGHIPGAINVPLEVTDFADRVSRHLATHGKRRVVVYGASADDPDSATAARRLHDAGLDDVYDYGEGLAGWQAAGNPVATPTAD